MDVRSSCDYGRIFLYLLKLEVIPIAEIILICGKICTGKTHWAKEYLASHPGVLLNADEITSLLPDLGEAHDTVSAQLRSLLLRKAADICRAGCTVVLDWGFWGRGDREDADAFFSSQNCPVRWIYLSPEEETWLTYRALRHEEILNGRSDVYELDEGLLGKLNSLFEAPDAAELHNRFGIQ